MNFKYYKDSIVCKYVYPVIETYCKFTILFIPDNLRNLVIFQVTMIWSIITQSQIT